MPDPIVKRGSQLYSGASKRRPDIIQKPINVQAAERENRIKVSHGVTWAALVHMDARLALLGEYPGGNLVISLKEGGRLFDLKSLTSSKIPDIQVIQMLSYMAFPAENIFSQNKKNRAIETYVSAIPLTFIDAWESYQRSIYPNKLISTKHGDILQSYILFIAISGALEYIKSLPSLSSPSVLPCMLPFAILGVYGNLPLHELLMDSKYKHIDVLDLTKRIVSNI